jgi:hypothetical protein
MNFEERFGLLIIAGGTLLLYQIVAAIGLGNILFAGFAGVFVYFLFALFDELKSRPKQ